MFRRLFLIVALSALAACAQQPIRTAAPPPAPVLTDPASVCLAALRNDRVAFETAAPFGDSDDGCGIDNPVKVFATGGDWSSPALLSCDLARTFSSFERNVLQPAALEIFGLPVVRIHHAGTYACRTRRNAAQAAAQLNGAKGGRLSEHSKGKAIDLVAFELADGTKIDVKRHWRQGDARAAFLKRISRESCSVFNVVLTPNHDRYHQDHLHLDIGPWALCGF